mgnify:CR=1 FL=1
MPAPRLFTVREAEATLPLVREKFSSQAAPEVLAALRTAEQGECVEVRELREAAAREAQRIHDFLVELEGVGCVFKGFDAGLVDFYALREDRLVCLCWRQGEGQITHWHEVDAGYAGRQPLDEIMFAETVNG